jgi:uncharacterized protein
LKLQPDRIEGVNVVSGLHGGAVAVNGIPYSTGIVVPWQGDVSAWGDAGFEGLVAADFERLIALKPELVIFGSGPRIRFPSAALMRPLIERRIGFETMDTAAACRTYNVLVGEGRLAVAALLPGAAG